MKMNFPKSVLGFGVLAAAASANAGVLGISGESNLIFDGGHVYAVIDVYIVCSNQFDKVVNFFGQSSIGNNSFVRTTLNGVQNAGDAASATNGLPFVQESGTGWMPSTGSTKAWDSFVTMGARTQADAANNQAIAGDSYFVNAFTVGADTLQGGYSGANYVGPGWQANLPNNPQGSAGAYANKQLMLGRFSVDVTNLDPFHNTESLQFRGKVTMKVNGTVFGGGTTSQFLIDKNFVYDDWRGGPAPGAAGLLGLASLLTRRRK